MSQLDAVRFMLEPEGSSKFYPVRPELKFCLGYFSKSCTSLGSLNISHLHITLKVKELSNGDTKHWRPWWESTASKRRKIGTRAFICCCLSAGQESSGFSPFELVFGHMVRGPFKLQLKEKLLLYVSDFRAKLLESLRLPVRSVRSKHSRVAIAL